MTGSRPTELRTIKLGKLGKGFPTTPSLILVRTHAYAVTSWESISQLPLNNYAVFLSNALGPVGKELGYKFIPNLKNYIFIMWLRPVLSCGGITPILRMGRTPKGVRPTSRWGSPRSRGPPQLLLPTIPKSSWTTATGIGVH